jgi:hypothetical protein
MGVGMTRVIRGPRRQARGGVSGSLPGHRDPVALLGGDEVVVVVGVLPEVDLDPVDAPGEGAFLGPVVSGRLPSKGGERR